MSSDPEKLQMLSGALIVLSLALLFCWYSKQRSYFSGSDKYGTFRALEGMGMDIDQLGLMNKKARRGYLPDLQMSNNSGFDPTRQSLHDMVNPGVQFHVPQRMRDKIRHTNMLWSSEAFVASPEDMAVGDADSMYAMNNEDIQMLNKGGVVIPSEIVTPLKTDVGDMSDCNSVSTSVMQLQNTDYMPQYGSLAGSGGVSL